MIYGYYLQRANAAQEGFILFICQKWGWNETFSPEKGLTTRSLTILSGLGIQIPQIGDRWAERGIFLIMSHFAQHAMLTAQAKVING